VAISLLNAFNKFESVPTTTPNNAYSLSQSFFSKQLTKTKANTIHTSSDIHDLGQSKYKLYRTFVCITNI